MSEDPLEKPPENKPLPQYPLEEHCLILERSEEKEKRKGQIHIFRDDIICPYFSKDYIGTHCKQLRRACPYAGEYLK